MKNKFKVGDKVKVGQLDINKFYRNGVIGNLIQFKGKTTIITRVAGHTPHIVYYLEDCGLWGWSDDMFDLIEEKEEDRVEKHRAICKELSDTYEKKNHDYGDSFTILREEYPDAILIRLFDKYNRLKTLMKGNSAKVEDESIKDTLLDLANYCILEVMEMDKK